MKKAFVELRGCMSYVHGGRTFLKDQAQVVIEEELLNHLVNTHLFSIRPIEDPTPPAPHPAPAKAKPVVAEQVEEPEEEVVPPSPPKVEPKKPVVLAKKKRGVFK
jgi:outer membrane biosynthesis protein TonB